MYTHVYIICTCMYIYMQFSLYTLHVRIIIYIALHYSSITSFGPKHDQHPGNSKTQTSLAINLNRQLLSDYKLVLTRMLAQDAFKEILIYCSICLLHHFYCPHSLINALLTTEIQMSDNYQIIHVLSRQLSNYIKSAKCKII